ncbi:TonB-dependent receptor [Chitinophaga pendula]|uniref:TonB-dependent receptor n=1 Tax=Chitinophaga TaxID=79328 RepID=UPI0018DF7DBF|nr:MULTISPECIES: TonB-dependent receptor [Chitinophaga]UCJ08303.1 TonB-dependent receptor [Chitinophaga pendula]
MMRYLRRFSLFLLLLVVAPFTYGQTLTTLSGKVVNDANVPIVSVTVSLDNTSLTATTDESGVFSFQQVAPGNHTLTFRHLGYKRVSKVISVTAGEAQQVSITLETSDQTLREIVVSTQKRTQSSIEVPIAISAISGTTLDHLNIRQMDEMAQFIPGLQVQLQSPNNPGYVIRGITSDEGDSRSQPRISIFQDGVSISRSRASVVELFDMERVEVVKGPQGTLFGRGAEIGAVHLIQNKAQHIFSAQITGGYGTYNHRFVNGYINTPIIKDKLANRFAANYEARDGFIGNLSGGRLNGKGVYAFRNSTRLTASDRTTADLILNYQYDDYPGTSFKSQRFAPKGGDTDPNTFADLEQGKNLYIKRHVGSTTLLIDHQLNDRWKLSSISGFRKFDSDESFDADGTPAPILWVSEKAKGDQYSQEIRFNYEDKKRFSGFIGASYFYENSSQEVPMRINEQYLYPAYVAPLLSNQLSSQIGALGTGLGLPAAQIAALRQAVTGMFTTQPVVVNGTPMPVTNLPNLQPFALNLISQLVPGGSPPGLTWPQLVQSGMIPATIPRQLIGLVNVLNGSPISSTHSESSTNYGKNQAFEIYGDGTLQLTDRLKLTAGIRGSYEKQRAGYYAPEPAQPSVFGMIANNGSHTLLNPVSTTTIYATKEYFSYVGRLALNYMFNKNNIYATVSKGRRPGVINIFPAKTTYLKPEEVWSYEAGIKGIVAKGKLSYDFTAYYYDWNNFQTLSYQPQPGSIALQLLASDGGKAHSFGLEAALRYLIVRNVSIFGNYAYVDGRFNEYNKNGEKQEYAGHRFRLTPAHSFAVGADANISLSSKSMIYIRPSYSYKSGVYFEDSNRADLYQKGYGLANFTAGYQFRVNNNRYEIGAYGRNIFDTKYIIDAGNSGDNIGFPTYVGGSRSIVGLQLKATF